MWPCSGGALMDARRIAFWVGGIALATGLVAFGTQTLSLMQALKESQETNQRAIARLAESNAKLQLETEKARQLTEQVQLIAEERRFETQELVGAQARCQGYVSTLANLESDFASLRSRHGTMISTLKSCTQNSSSDDAGGCVITVCGFAWLTGNVNCGEVVNSAAQLTSTIEDTQRAAAQANCPQQASPALSFMNN